VIDVDMPECAVRKKMRYTSVFITMTTFILSPRDSRQNPVVDDALHMVVFGVVVEVGEGERGAGGRDRFLGAIE
jgi:hypothetical protein